jgi:hypothetical protein
MPDVAQCNQASGIFKHFLRDLNKKYGVRGSRLNIIQ